MLYLIKYYEDGKDIEPLDTLSNMQTSLIKRAIDRVKEECCKVEVAFNDLILYTIQGGLSNE